MCQLQCIALGNDGMAHKIRCSDGVDVPWPWPCASVTSLSSEQLRALRAPDALTRALAHEALTSYQLAALYGARGARLRAEALRRLARRIRAAQLEPLCEGLSERALTVIFGRTTNRLALVSALAAQEPKE